MKKNKKTMAVFVILLMLFLVLFCTRFLFGGDEDTWICKNGNWQKHGNPNYAMPKQSCPPGIDNK